LAYPAPRSSSLFLFPAAATSVLYTLSLHDALPILDHHRPVPLVVGADVAEVEALGQLEVDLDRRHLPGAADGVAALHGDLRAVEDRKSTRLNSSHVKISYAVFCLKKKKKRNIQSHR